MSNSEIKILESKCSQEAKNNASGDQKIRKCFDFCCRIRDFMYKLFLILQYMGLDMTRTVCLNVSRNVGINMVTDIGIVPKAPRAPWAQGPFPEFLVFRMQDFGFSYDLIWFSQDFMWILI